MGDGGGAYVTPPKLLLLQIKLNWAGLVGGPVFFPFSDFLAACWQEFDSKFILYRWKRVFVGIFKKKGLGPDRTPSAGTSPPHTVFIVTIQGSKGTCIPSQDRSYENSQPRRDRFLTSVVWIFYTICVFLAVSFSFWLNRRAKFDAASCILVGEIRNRTNEQTHTNKFYSKRYILTLLMGRCG